MIRKMLLTATMLVAGSTAAQATILLNEGFDDIGTLAGSGWSLINNSTPAGETGWFQGNLFDAHSGAADSYIAANFLNAGTGGAISNWLLSPTLMLSNNMTMTFYTRTADLSFADQLQIRLSTSGSSSDVSAFSTLAYTVNPTLGSDYPAEWTQYTVNFSGFTDGVLGRIAFNYVIPDTNVYGNYIGIDSVQVAAPEPSTFALMLAALLPLGFAARRRKNALKKLAIGMSLVASTGIAAADEAATDANIPKEQPGLMSFPHVRVMNAPVAATQSAGDKSAGVKVYIDPTTKQIREQTLEEAQEEAKAATAARSSAKNARAAASSEGTTLYGPGNSVGKILGEETMIYAVAHKQEAGVPAWECVTGNEAATKALETTKVSSSNAAEVRDER